MLEQVEYVWRLPWGAKFGDERISQVDTRRCNKAASWCDRRQSLCRSLASCKSAAATWHAPLRRAPGRPRSCTRPAAAAAAARRHIP
jgi:hypothetical protein